VKPGWRGIDRRRVRAGKVKKGMTRSCVSTCGGGELKEPLGFKEWKMKSLLE
jgi:hypothetical protein